MASRQFSERINFTTTIASGAAASATVVTLTVGPTPSRFVSYSLTVPNYTNTVNTTVYIFDSDGYPIYIGSAHAKDNTYYVGGLEVPLMPGDVVKLITSGDIGSGPNQCRLRIGLA